MASSEWSAWLATPTVFQHTVPLCERIFIDYYCRDYDCSYNFAATAIASETATAIVTHLFSVFAGRDKRHREIISAISAKMSFIHVIFAAGRIFNFTISIGISMLPADITIVA